MALDDANRAAREANDALAHARVDARVAANDALDASAALAAADAAYRAYVDALDALAHAEGDDA